MAAAVGGLIGVEREHRDDQQVVIAGIRTFPLIAIAGFLIAFLAERLVFPMLTVAGVLGGFAIAVTFMWMRHARGLSGITTPVTAAVTFLLGIVIGYGYVFEAVVVGVAATFLLVAKQHLHRFASILDDRELLSALQFITLVFILLPLTVDLEPPVAGFEWLGRGALVDPFTILLVVVFVSSISFASLLAMRMIGPRRGFEFSGAMGGLVNSEATTAGLAQRARETQALMGAAIVGSLLASTTMLGRNLAIAAFADRTLGLAKWMLPLSLPVALVGVLAALRRRQQVQEPPHESLRVGSPFAVLPALRFALIFTIVTLLAGFAADRLGEVGVYATALGGFVSAGAVIAGAGSLHASGAVSLEVALRTAMLATAASVSGKLVILKAVDAEAFRRGLRPYLAMSVAAVLAAVASFVWP